VKGSGRSLSASPELDKPDTSKEGRQAGLSGPWLGGGDGGVRRPPDTGRPAGPAWDGPAGAPPATHGRGTPAAISPADQRDEMAARRSRARRAVDPDLRPRAARRGRRGDRGRRRGGRVVGRARRSRAGRGLADAGGRQFLVDHQRAVLRAAGGAGGAAAVPAADRLCDRGSAGELDRRGLGWCHRPASTAVRGDHPGRLGWLGAAVGAADLLRGAVGRDLVHAGAGGPLA
jgi:hypothetical protein